MQTSFFEGFKVIELASVLAGPAVGMFFAEMGATVTKIENKQAGGDITRGWRLENENQEASISAYYCAVNYQKNVVFLDLKQQDDRARVYEMVQEADLVIANFKKSSARALGMDYEQLSTLNPRLIYANISGFGEHNPRVAFDVVLQAESGFMYMNGQSTSPPTKMPVALIDILAAHQLKEAILIALLQRSKHQKGAYVSVSLLDAAIASLANQATNWLMAGQIPVQRGSEHPNIAPYGDLFETADGKWIVLAIGSDKQFQKLCAFFGRKNLCSDTRFKNNTNRVQHRQPLYDELCYLIKQVDAHELLQYCHQQLIPLGQVRNMQEVFETKAAQNLVLTEQIEGVLTRRVSTIAFRFRD